MCIELFPYIYRKTHTGKQYSHTLHHSLIRTELVLNKKNSVICRRSDKLDTMVLTGFKCIQSQIVLYQNDQGILGVL